jgi:hypothetical protein
MNAPTYKLNPSEGYEQQTVCEALTRAGIGHFSVPNEGKRSVITAANMKRRGLRRGAPDVVIMRLAPVNGRPTMIEMKRKKGGVYSDDQAELHAEARAEGWNVITPPPGCGGVWVIEQLRGLGYPL